MPVNIPHTKPIRTGCSQHPEYRGEGALPDQNCRRCQSLQSAWTELQAALTNLLKG